jgi:RNA polymerase sigma-70 factor (ECF subfamily)
MARLAIAEAVTNDREIESDAFMDAIAPWLPAAYRLAFGLVHNRDEIDDIVQEATLNAWKHRGSRRPSSELKAWFLAIVANQCRQAVRTKWWSVIRRPDFNSVDGLQNDQQSDRVEELRQALLRLKHRDRVVLVLRYYMDMSFEDIASTLRISPEAARVRTHRALARLRPILNSLEDPNNE